MKPYYEHAGITIYHGDCREVMASDCPFEVGSLNVCATDPPYGIGYRSTHNSHRSGGWAKWTRSENFEPIQGDDQPFDPSHLLQFWNIIIFGANYFADKLPPSKCWVVWDKRDGIGSNDFADCELIWTNLEKPSRLFRHVWSGLIRAGRENVSREDKFHPHQKPVALMKYLLSMDTFGTVIDPYCGSGSTLIAAKELGHKAIGIDIEEKWCEVSAKRLSQEVFQFGAAEKE